MIALDFQADLGTADLVLGPSGLVRDDSLKTAVILSLFTDRRAGPDDAAGNDRRGWVGDALASDGDRWGSRLWLLRRDKQIEETRRRAIDYAQEALAWLVDDGIAASVAVEAEWIRPTALGLTVSITLTAGSAERYRLVTQVAA